MLLSIPADDITVMKIFFMNLRLEKEVFLTVPFGISLLSKLYDSMFNSLITQAIIHDGAQLATSQNYTLGIILAIYHVKC